MFHLFLVPSIMAENDYCLRSVSPASLISQDLFKETNLDMTRNLQHLHMNKKSYTYKTLPFNSH